MMPSVGSTTVVYLPENCCKMFVVEKKDNNARPKNGLHLFAIAE
jgi:hypothetical protein